MYRGKNVDHHSVSLCQSPFQSFLSSEHLLIHFFKEIPFIFITFILLTLSALLSYLIQYDVLTCASHEQIIVFRHASLAVSACVTGHEIMVESQVSN